MTEKPKAKAKRIPCRIYVDIRRMVDPNTGEVVGCLVPVGEVDREILRRKRIKVGARIRTTVTRERSYGQHKYVHKLGQFLEANVEGFAGKDPHAIVKEVQLAADAMCDHERLQIPGYEGYLVRKVPRSIAYDEMDEGDFQQLVRQLCAHIAEKHLPGMTPEQVQEAVELMPTDVA